MQIPPSLLLLLALLLLLLLMVVVVVVVWLLLLLPPLLPLLLLLLPLMRTRKRLLGVHYLPVLCYGAGYFGVAVGRSRLLRGQAFVVLNTHLGGTVCVGG